MDDRPMPFEEALEQLEKIVHELEEGQIGLEESLRRYEDGVKLLRHCYGMLQTAERRIELLTGVDAEGRPLTEPFDGTATVERSRPNAEGAARSSGAPLDAESEADDDPAGGRLF